MKVVAVLPVYNEQPAIVSQIVQNLRKYVNEIIIVNDGSTDNFNYSLLKKEDIHLLKHLINRGQGAALQTGTDYALKIGADIIVHFDADGQHQTEDIPALIKPLQQNTADFVFGSRFLNGSSCLPFFKKYFILPLAKLVNYLFTGLKLTDAHNGLRAFNRTAAKKIHLTQDRMAHATQYPYLVKKYKIKYTEVPVKIIYHEFGQGLGGGIKIIKELLIDKIIK